MLAFELVAEVADSWEGAFEWRELGFSCGSSGISKNSASLDLGSSQLVRKGVSTLVSNVKAVGVTGERLAGDVASVAAVPYKEVSASGVMLRGSGGTGGISPIDEREDEGFPKLGRRCEGSGVYVFGSSSIGSCGSGSEALRGVK